MQDPENSIHIRTINYQRYRIFPSPAVKPERFFIDQGDPFPMQGIKSVFERILRRTIPPVAVGLCYNHIYHSIRKIGIFI